MQSRTVSLTHAFTDSLTHSLTDSLTHTYTHTYRYKILEAAYCFGLESLNENLPEIKCELVFTQRRLQLRPNLEELRTTYFKQMRRFIEIPIKFQGFSGDNASVYRRMFHRNGSALIQVYKKASDLFDRLQTLRDSMKPWTALGTIVDVDDYVQSEVKTIQEYDTNFKMIRKRMKQSEKISDFYRVDCFYVSMAPFKATVEDHIQRLEDALLLSLRKTLSAQIRVVEEFADEAMDRLNTRPKSIEEIGEARVKWKELGERKRGVRQELKRCEDKMKLLVAVAGNRMQIEDIQMRLNCLPSRWENIEIAMEAFNDMIEEQRERLKDQIDGLVMECESKIEKFFKRWDALKPNANSFESAKDLTSVSIAKMLEDIEEWRSQFEELEKESSTLQSNCEHFQMPVPPFEILSSTEEELDKTESEWQQLKEYREEWDTYVVLYRCVFVFSFLSLSLFIYQPTPTHTYIYDV